MHHDLIAISGGGGHGLRVEIAFGDLGQGVGATGREGVARYRGNVSVVVDFFLVFGSPVGTVCREISGELEGSEKFRNELPHGEPQLGKRGLYRRTGGENLQSREYAMLWLLNLSDGNFSLPDIAERSGVPIDDLRIVAGELVDAGVLTRI